MKEVEPTGREYFDAQIRRSRRLLPDTRTVGGFGTYLKYERVAALMAEPRNHNILDLGCNRGSIEYILENQYFPGIAPSKNVIGIDVAGPAIIQAQWLALKNITFLLYGGGVLPFRDGSFDLIVMVEVIEHIDNKRYLLSEVRRILRKGGHLLLTTPNPSCWTLRLEKKLWVLARKAFGKPIVNKDAYIDADTLRQYLDEEHFGPNDSGETFTWPRAFIHFRGWSVFPFLPPALVLLYQRIWVSLSDFWSLPVCLQKRLMWTIWIQAEAV